MAPPGVNDHKQPTLDPPVKPHSVLAVALPQIGLDTPIGIAERRQNTLEAEAPLPPAALALQFVPLEQDAVIIRQIRQLDSSCDGRPHHIFDVVGGGGEHDEAVEAEGDAG